MNLPAQLLLALLGLLFASLAASAPGHDHEHERELAADDVSAQCAALAAQSMLTNVSFVVEPACNTAAVAMDGCVPLTPCQLCRSAKTPLNELLTSCAVLDGSRLRAQQQQQQQQQQQPQQQSRQATVTPAVAPAAVQASQLEVSGGPTLTASASTEAPSAEGLSTAEVLAVVVVALGALVGAVLVIQRHHQRRLEEMQEEALATPRDAGNALVSVQSRTQIATI